MNSMNFRQTLIDSDEIQLILELAGIGYWSINVESGAVYASTIFWSMLGYEPYEMESTLDDMKKIHYPEDWEKGWEMIADLFTGKTQTYENEVRYLSKDGRWVSCEVKGAIAKFKDDGSPLIFVGYSKNIEKRKGIEAELKKALDLNATSKDELENALTTIQGLVQFMPICSKCKSIRNDEGAWKEWESYIESHSNIVFSHGLCKSCQEQLYGEQGWFKRYKEKLSKDGDPER